MTSFRQIEANRQNALRSTGPKSHNGRRRSRRNALRHGLNETVIEGLEDTEDHRAFEAAVISDYDAIDNGCMQFVPGSHLARTCPGACAARCCTSNKLAARRRAGCPLEVGVATIHLPKTLHYAGPNNTDTIRYAWILQIGIRDWIPTILR
jgi:Phytanoyl-CoA dioxygenase (PhyH)